MATRAALEFHPGSSPRGVTATAAQVRHHSQRAALPRQRLIRLLPEVVNRQLTLVVAPAGSGKTSLLNTYAELVSAPVAWFRPESTQSDERALVHRLERTITSALPGVARGWQNVDDVVDALSKSTARCLLIMDDFHLLAGTPAERSVERLAEFAPAGLSLLIASRVLPSFNLPRLRVLDAVVEIGTDDLRFRSWEVEQLFRDFYGQHLPPEELATLTRHTWGWSAALQLFHVATRGKEARHRRRILNGMNGHSRLVREFLTRNVVDELSEEERSFLIKTSVLGRLSGRLCDELLGNSGSATLIEQLERRQLVVSVAEEWGEYRCHEVLRSHLEMLFIDQVGEVEARAHYRRAGELLERSGATIDSACAYARGEVWDAVSRVVGRDDLVTATSGSDLIELLPPGMRNDPWLLLAQARRYRAEGRFDEAVSSYKEAAERFGSTGRAAVCRVERRALEVWLNSDEPRGTDWVARLRRATMHAQPEPLQSPASSAAPHDLFVDGVAALLAGRLENASALLEDVAKSQYASPALSVAARLGFSVVTLLSGDPRGVVEAEMAAEDADRLGLTWLSRLCRIVLALGNVPGNRSESAAARIAFEHRGDRWGVALALLIDGIGLLRAGGDASRSLNEAVERLRPLNASVVEAWAKAMHGLALARSGHPEASTSSLLAATAARDSGARAAQGIAYLAAAEADKQGPGHYRSVAEGLLNTSGLSIGSRVSLRAEDRLHAPPRVSIRCLGGFEIKIEGVVVDFSRIKPRAREALRLLCIHRGKAVHREVLLTALWPELDTPAGMRNLHVALSSLRSLLQVDGEPLIAREGSAYRIKIPEYGTIDVIQFERALREAHRLLNAGDPRAVELFRHALEMYGDDLLPEDGPAEWVVPAREHLRTEAYALTLKLAQLLLEFGDPVGCAAACERGLQIDPYRDDLWRLRIDALGQAGDFAAAARARQNYDRVLTALGVPIQY
jgi:DNA-binding SARP family transcriptional activator